MGALRLAVAALAALALVPASARADAPWTDSESVTSGGLTATLTWDDTESGLMNARLEITRNGADAFDAAIPGVVCDFCTIQQADDVRIVDFDDDGEPQVMVVANTGERDCCSVMGIYDYDPAMDAYGETVRNWGSAGFGLDDLDDDGVPEILASDVRFENLRDAFPPPAVFHFLHQDGVAVMVDVTTEFPGVVRLNAAQAKRRLARVRRGSRDARGYVSAYVADQFILGHGATGIRELNRQLRRGAIDQAFKRRLLRFLSVNGYR